jgi:hypothetical protein
VVNTTEQENALKFISDHVWTPQYWLVDEALVSKFAKGGKLESLINMNKGVLNRLTNAKRLNMMWDTHSTLPGEGLSPQELLDALVKDILTSRTTPDQVERELQKHLVHQLIELEKDKDLALELKGHSLALQNGVLSNLKTEMNTSDQTLKAHYTYMVKMLEKAMEIRD